MSIGSDLREAREQHGLTLRDITDRTKIRGPVLRAIEQDQFDPTIGAVIMRGFVKLYAREVGLDPSEMAARFNEVTAAAGLDAGASGEPTTAHDAVSGSRPLRPATAGAVALLLIVGAGWLAWQVWSGRRAASEPAVSTAPVALPAPVAPASPAPAAPAAAPPPTKPEPPPALPPEPGVLRITVEAIDACWLAATADGRPAAFRTLNAGETLTLEIREEAVLRMGVPGNLSVRINGRAIRPLPRPATPATLRITPETYRDLLEP